VLESADPDVRVINLETAITTSDDAWPGKSIHYRMHPANAATLTAAGIDCCALANNHVLDWGYDGLADTMATLRKARIPFAGVGSEIQQAAAPAVCQTGDDRRVLVFAMGCASSGISPTWAALEGRPGVQFLPRLSHKASQVMAAKIQQRARPDDIVIVSIHWGGNWGYHIPDDQIALAHHLSDQAGVDVVHGHSSHHVKAMGVYKERLILYGCGDFINDYEGIAGHESYRPDLSVMYFPSLDQSGRLKHLRLVPLVRAKMRLQHASVEDRHWLRDLLVRESVRFGVRFRLDAEGDLVAQW
jgi:poly-gamma-glutamate synthesis protein (capsule biosynthesis protein)